MQSKAEQQTPYQGQGGIICSKFLYFKFILNTSAFNLFYIYFIAGVQGRSPWQATGLKLVDPVRNSYLCHSCCSILATR